MKKVADNYHLQLRGNVWYYVRRVPGSLVPIFGPVVKMSLHTRRKSEAKRLRTIRDVEFDAKFDIAGSASIGKAPGESAPDFSLDDILEYVRLAVSARDARSANELITDPPYNSVERQDLLIDAEIEHQILNDPDDLNRPGTAGGHLV